MLEKAIARCVGVESLRRFGFLCFADWLSYATNPSTFLVVDNRRERPRPGLRAQASQFVAKGVEIYAKA